MNQASSELIEDLGFARESLLKSVESLTQEHFDVRPYPNKWSVGEILHHLCLTERQISMLLEKMLERARSRNMPLANPNTPSLLHCLDAFSVEDPANPAQAPQYAVPTHGIAQDELLKSIKESRESLVNIAMGLCDYDLTDMRFPHPLLGKINMYQWLLCIGKHEQRHTRQIEALRQGIA